MHELVPLTNNYMVSYFVGFFCGFFLQKMIVVLWSFHCLMQLTTQQILVFYKDWQNCKLCFVCKQFSRVLMYLHKCLPALLLLPISCFLSKQIYMKKMIMQNTRTYINIPNRYSLLSISIDWFNSSTNINNI